MVSEKIAQHKILKGLDTLNKAEKEIIVDMVQKNITSISLTLFHAGAVCLVEKGILKRASEFQSHNCVYVINEFAWKKIKDDPRFSNKSGTI